MTYLFLDHMWPLGQFAHAWPTVASKFPNGITGSTFRGIYTIAIQKGAPCCP